MLSTHTRTPNWVPDAPTQWPIQICGFLLTWEGRTQTKHCGISFNMLRRYWGWGKRSNPLRKEARKHPSRDTLIELGHKMLKTTIPCCVKAGTHDQSKPSYYPPTVPHKPRASSDLYYTPRNLTRQLTLQKDMPTLGGVLWACSVGINEDSNSGGEGESLAVQG